MVCQVQAPSLSRSRHVVIHLGRASGRVGNQSFGENGAQFINMQRRRKRRGVRSKTFGVKKKGGEKKNERKSKSLRREIRA